MLPVVAAAAPAPEIIKMPGELERWVQVKADEFVIFSNAGKSKTKEIAEHLLRFRAALAKASKLPIHSPLPISVYAFKSTSAFAPYRDIILERRAKNVAGFFIHAWDGPLIVFDASGRWSAEHVIYHELTHAFIGNQGVSVPLWLREGAADFYAAFAIQDGSAKIGLPTGQIALLRKREWVPLAEVLAADSRSPLYTDAKRAPLFYAESWAMVHYLYADCPQRRGQLASYLEQLAAGRSDEQAFASAFGTGFDAFEKELKAYINGDAMQYLVLRGDQLGPINVDTPTALPHDEVLARLGRAGRSNRGGLEAVPAGAGVRPGRRPAGPPRRRGAAGPAREGEPSVPGRRRVRPRPAVAGAQTQPEPRPRMGGAGPHVRPRRRQGHRRRGRRPRTVPRPGCAGLRRRARSDRALRAGGPHRARR
ncbi:MAG: hypothetical protein B7Z68_02750 [Acidobacteria bacterium 21-70-11]|nr:MAG: hypothetical protein B7Z68_02750 [Acidobacteria bacterium 21-70-11]